MNADWNRVHGQNYGYVEYRRDQSENDWLIWLLVLPVLVPLGLARWAIRHPVFTVLIGLGVLTWLHVGTWAVIVLAVLIVGLLLVWRHRHRSSYERLVANRARRTRRGWWVYKRRWKSAMTLAGLAAIFEREQYAPKIRKIRSDRYGDYLLVRLLSGQEPGDFENRAEALANTFGALSCRVRVDRPGRIWLDFMRHDPLVPVVPALDVAEPVDLTALPLGIREAGQTWTLRLLGTHVLVGGATGSGKGSVIWSAARALGPAIRVGTVALWVADPKGGMELAPGWPCYTRFACESPDSIAELLTDAEMVVRQRAAQLRGITRQHTPTRADPLVVVVVDEIAALTGYLPDRDVKRRIAASLSVILTQGRAVGVSVMAAVQDPRKEILPFRDLFPTRIALRLTEAEQADLVLGHGAHNRGAACERIPVTQPGVGYVLLDGQREPVRVRAAQATDADIAELARTYPAPASAERTSDAELAAVIQEWSE
jgi:S-DNA-T family DNA segregation ATPase FtsK/SpoIIIE